MGVWAVKGDRTTEPHRDGGITARPQTTALQRHLRRRRQRGRGAALFVGLCSGVRCGFWRRNVFKVRTLWAPRAASCYLWWSRSRYRCSHLTSWCSSAARRWRSSGPSTCWGELFCHPPPPPTFPTVGIIIPFHAHRTRHHGWALGGGRSRPGPTWTKKKSEFDLIPSILSCQSSHNCAVQQCVRYTDTSLKQTRHRLETRSHILLPPRHRGAWQWMTVGPQSPR